MIGEKVKCINSKGTRGLIEGQEYTINIISQCPTCKLIVYGLVELPNYPNGTDPKLGVLCTCGYKHYYFGNVYNSSRFVSKIIETKKEVICEIHEMQLS